jgi:APA family basic amino acid/polyamine antiporter
VARRGLFERKSVDAIIADAEREEGRLRRELSGFDLMIIGIGVIVGAGIFVRTPAVWFVAPASIVLSVLPMTELSWLTWLRFAIWMAIGLAISFGYSRGPPAVA